MPAPHSTEKAPTAAALPEPRAHEAGPAAGDGSPRTTRDDLRNYAAQGGFSLTSESNPWYAAAGTVTTAEEARTASTALAELRGRDLPALRDAAPRIAETTPLAEPATPAELAATAALLARVQGTLRTLHAEAYEADLEALAHATTGGPALSGPRRALRKQAKRLAVSSWRRRATRHSALAEALLVREAWQEVAPGTTPALPSDEKLLDQFLQHVQGMEASLRELDRVLPGRDADRLPLEELAELLDQLAADEGTLHRLAALHQLRTALEEAGLGSLLAELTERRAGAEEAVEAFDALYGPADKDEPESDAAEAVTEPESEPEAKAEVEPEPEVEAEAEVEPEPAADEPEAPAAVAEPDPVVEEAAAPETVAETDVPVEAQSAPIEAETPALAAEPAEPEAAAEPESAPSPDPEPEPAEAAAEAPAPSPEPEPQPEPQPQPEEVAAAAEAAAPAPAAGKSRRPRKPALTAGQPISAYSATELAALARWIDSDGVERTDEELLRAAMKELGFARLGPRIKEALSAAVETARSAS